VHGRTRACAFSGPVEYDTVASMVEAVDIPVFANGDIDSAQQAAAVLDYTGAAGVMIGRAAQGRPWLCGQIATYLETGVTAADLSPESKLAIIRRHVCELHLFYGEYVGVRTARKHVGWFLDAHGYPKTQRRLFNQLAHPKEQLHYIDQHIGFQHKKELAA